MFLFIESLMVEGLIQKNREAIPQIEKIGK